MMYRTTAAALALLSFLPRLSLAYQPIDLCCPPPCSCEWPPVECCDPCEASAPASEQPQTSAPSPTPAEPAAKQPTPADSAPAEIPPPPPAPAPNADAITPQPLNTPDIDASVAAPVEPAPAPAAAPVEPPPAEPAPRYSAPPATPAGEPASADVEPATTTEEPEPEPTEPGAVDIFTAPAAETTPAEEPATPPAAEEPAAPPAEEPASAPEGDDLFGPTSSGNILTQPGGWASNESREWKNATGQPLLAGRVTDVTASFVILSREDGQSQAVRFAQLDVDDLAFLRQQIEARQVQLASQTGEDELLAGQSR